MRHFTGLLLCALGGVACGSTESEVERTAAPETRGVEPSEDELGGGESGEPEPVEPAAVLVEEGEPGARRPNELPTDIDGIVAHYNASHGMWRNGMSASLDAAETATTLQVLTELFTRISFDPGPVTEFEVLEERTVRIEEEDYKAVRLTTNLGPKIVLLQYQSVGWWTRVLQGA